MKLLEAGTQELWWCPSCGRVLHKPPYTQGLDRFHSWRCQEPLRRAIVEVRPIHVGASEAPDEGGDHAG